ncbi:MAG: efflux RND transporter periplasmic adaptor subunit [Bacteroidota bacterium]
MKNSFRVLVLVLLAIWVGYTLFQNKEYKELIISRAERSLPAVPVRVATLEPRTLQSTISVSGRVVGTNEVFITPMVSGEVLRLTVKPGTDVKKGQLIAIIDDFYLRQQLTLAEAAYEQDKKDHERLKSMAAVSAVTGQQLEQYALKVAASETQMALARRRLADARIRATVSGTVNQVFTSEGALIGPGRPICEIVGGPFNIIKTGIQERYRPYLQLGENVNLMDFQRVFETRASVSAVGVKPNQMGKVPLEVAFDPIEALYAGRWVDVAIEVNTDTALFLPIQALRKSSSQNFVMVANGNRAERRSITINEEIGGSVRVLAGLTAGEQVILEGGHLVHPGDSLRIITQ